MISTSSRRTSFTIVRCIEPDVKFLWSLLEMIPAAETVSGDIGEADYDIEYPKGLISDAIHSGDGARGEALRPVFIDYLRKHSDA
jgi:hypothetical protein